MDIAPEGEDGSDACLLDVKEQHLFNQRNLSSFLDSLRMELDMAEKEQSN